MKYLDFMPEEKIGLDTVIMHAFTELTEDINENWLTQSTNDIYAFCKCANSFYSAIAEYFAEEVYKDDLPDNIEYIKLVASTIAKHVSKDYDVTFSRKIKKEKTTMVNVQKTKKVGLFKTKSYIEKEAKTETYYEQEEVTLKGWRIERFYRQEGNGNHKNTLYLDYCLGADGELYMVASKENQKESDFKVFSCFCFSPGLLNNKYCNIFNSVISGMLGVLDAVPISRDDPRRSFHKRLDDDYYYNFSLQIDDDNDYPYSFLDGTIIRLNSLLNENEKKEIILKNEKFGIVFGKKDETRNTDNKAKQKEINSNNNKDVEGMIDVDLFAQVGAKLYGQFNGGIDLRFTTMLIEQSILLAESIAKKRPDFVPIAKAIRYNSVNGVECFLGKNIDELFKAQDLFTVDIDYTILLVANTVFLERDNSDQSLSNKSIICIEGTLKDNPEADILGIHANALMCVALWFSDYKGYKQLVYDHIVKLSGEGWYKEDAEINIDEVRKSI